MNVRLACAGVLAPIIRGSGSLSTALPPALASVAGRDRALLQELCFGTLRHYPALETIVEHLMDQPIKTREAEVTALLMAGLYQIRELRTPDHAVVNETVAAVKQLKKNWARGLVNGVLRRYLRERERIDEACARDARYRTLHPPWLQQALTRAWPGAGEDIMAANNSRPPMCLRVNRLRTTRDDYLAVLERAGIAARPAGFCADGLYLEKPVDVGELPGFGDGLCSVQDEAAQLAAELMDLHPGQRVVDACAAPGGKSCHMLERCNALAELIALDIDSRRLERVGDNLARLGLSATPVAADAANLDAWWDGRPLDRILLDAPCSASGVIRRHPDIKLLRNAGDIAKLTRAQSELLTALWRALASGGKMVYATCSVLPEENDGVVGAFVQSRNDCRPEVIDVPWGIATGFGRQLLPQPGSHDGFYYAVLEKK